MNLSSDAWRADPFSVLGRHGDTVSAFAPGALAVDAVSATSRRKLAALAEAEPGLFCGKLSASTAYRLRITWPDGAQEVVNDPYRFSSTLGELDLHLLAQGDHRDLADKLGAHEVVLDGVPGVVFSVWAPAARAVAVIGDFNAWDGRRHPMGPRGAGVWELFVPALAAGARYKFEVLGADGVLRQKADPVARATEVPPATASIVAPPLVHDWGDDEWMAQRAQRHHRGAPISIYEVHAPSWKRPWDDRSGPHDWDELGDLLIPYALDLGFTHIELLPIMEHPFGGSWGYQPLSQFAPSARFGSPAQLARFVDRCHQAGLGVILDWVPGHFPSDPHGLERFDGSALYEHPDPQMGFHPDWNTLIYDFEKPQVQGFLVASALWWLERFHIDGLRVDAVASMLYRDYSRPDGQWTPNVHGGRENLEAVAFLQKLNGVVAERCPGAITLAEESTAWPGVTAPPEHGGLGFTYKWNMGWMNDTLRYMSRDPVHRRWHGGEIGFGLHYAFNEAFVLPLSHDEVVHGKGALLGKMPGDPWRRFANLRALLALMWAHPGKKLMFMGGEFAQPGEWNHDTELDWGLLANAEHLGVQRLLRDLNRLYVAEGGLHHTDSDPAGFEWIVENDEDNSVLVFLRRSFHGGAPLIAAFNMTPEPKFGYRVGAPMEGRWTEVINTDAHAYGGGDIGNCGGLDATLRPTHGYPASLDLTLPPLAAIILRYSGSET